MLKKLSLFVLYIIIAVVVFSCASDYQKGPFGGESDRIAPTVISSFPLNGSINQNRDLDVEIEFSEYLKFASTKKAITISPLTVAENSEIVWGEKDVDIKFRDLEDSTTVLVIVNTSLQDARGNGLADNYVLTFSTGDVIDSTSFSGSTGFAIEDNSFTGMVQNKTKVLVYRYKDVLDSGFVLSSPIYRVGVNKEFAFNLPHLKKDLYLPLVFQDDNNNDRLDINGGELYSFGSGIVDLRNNNNCKDLFVCGIADTLPPFIKDISAENVDLLKIEFSEPILTDAAIVDSVIMNQKNIFKYECRKSGDRKYLYVQVDSLEDNKEITLYTTFFKDEYGNEVNPKMRKRMVILENEVLKDTLHVVGKVTTRIAIDDTLMIPLSKISQTVALKLFPTEELKRSYSLNEKAKKVDFGYKIPMIDLGIEEGRYKFLVESEGDTLYYNNFFIEKPVGFGYISGTVISVSKLDEIVLLFDKVGKGNKIGSSKKLLLKGNESYKVDLRPGKYTVSAYLDRDRDGRYSAGNIKNYNEKMSDILFSEKAIILPDTIQVRKNWESSGYNIDFNK